MRIEPFRTDAGDWILVVGRRVVEIPTIGGGRGLPAGAPTFDECWTGSGWHTSMSRAKTFRTLAEAEGEIPLAAGHEE